jgi:toxin-antitoxin system PIN domain toxin
MILVDANVLLYAVSQRLPNHERSRRWLEEALSGGESIGFAWIVLLAFVRIATRTALFPRPLDATTAFDVVDNWLAARPSIVVQPTARHANVLRGLLEQTGTAGNVVSDAHLAALAIEHGARVCTFDRDFGRFDGVRVLTPA